MFDDRIDNSNERQLLSPDTDGGCLAGTPQGDAIFMTEFGRHPSVMLLIDAESGNIVGANQAASAFYR